MENQQTIFVVTDGCYSDIHIVGLFSDRHKAEEIAVGLRDGEVSEWILDALVEHEVKTNVWEGMINFLYGDFISLGEDDRVVRPKGARGLTEVRYRYPKPGEKEPYGYVESYVSEEHARKMAAELRQAWLRKEHYEPK